MLINNDTHKKMCLQGSSVFSVQALHKCYVVLQTTFVAKVCAQKKS